MSYFQGKNNSTSSNNAYNNNNNSSSINMAPHGLNNAPINYSVSVPSNSHAPETERLRDMIKEVVEERDQIQNNYDNLLRKHEELIVVLEQRAS